MGNLLCCRTKKRTKSTGSSSSFNSEYDSHQLPWDAEAFQWGITTSQVKPPQVVASKSCPTRQPAKSCEACGETDHRADSCRYATRMCFYCRSEGHIMRICQKRKQGRKVLHHRIKAGGAYQVPTMELKN
uniref:CCHC-type domain-containing protein n=1 Tax=Anopheles arabiensis TaxID=7173 RepID=A0A182HMB7_ANOAR